MTLSVKKIQPSSYSGGGDGGLGERVASLETAVDHIRTRVETLHGDVRALLYGGIAAAVLIFGALIAGWLMLSNRIDTLSDRVAQLATQSVQIRDKLDLLNEKLSQPQTLAPQSPDAPKDARP